MLRSTEAAEEQNDKNAKSAEYRVEKTKHGSRLTSI